MINLRYYLDVVRNRLSHINLINRLEEEWLWHLKMT